MAQRATSIVRSVAGVRPDRSTRLSVDAGAEARAIPLDLTPIIEPYKGSSRRLSLRVERVPPFARLSRGRNNGDNSWSLATDELEDLAYIPPDNFQSTHTLLVRVVSVEDASTVAVLEYAVSPQTTSQNMAPARPATAARGASASSDLKLSRIEDELERVRAALTAHESVLSETLQKAGQAAAGASQQAIERELTKARADWDAERDRQLAETSTFWKAELQRCRDSWQAEHDTQLVELEERSRKELEAARQRFQSDASAALAKAERSWKADEAARLAAAEAQWKQQASVRPATSASVEERAARERAEAELNRVRAELTDALASAAERESALAQSRLQRQQELERLKADSEAALITAQKAWRAEEEKRLAQAQARWREESEGLLAELKAQCERAEASLQEARAETSSRVGQAQIDAQNARDRAERELRDIKAQFSTLQKRLAEREAEIAQVMVRAEETSARSHRDMQAALKQAEEVWRSEETARLAAAKAIWSKDAARLAAEARAEGDAARGQRSAELAQLRQDMAALRALASEKEAENDRLRADADRAIEEMRQRSEAALSQAERAWKTEEAARLSSARAQWNDDMSAALAEATQRYQQAETALAQQRARTEAALRRGGDDDQLSREVAVLQAALATCEKELSQLRAALGETRDDGTLEAQAILEPLAARAMPMRHDEDDVEPEPAINRALMRDVFVIALVVVVAILALPFIESYLPDDWQMQIAQLTGSISTETATKTSLPQPLPAPMLPRLHMEQTSATTNIRATPSATGDLVIKLQAGTDVAVFEQQGKWTHVKLNPRSAQPTEGWVLTSRLSDPDDVGAAPDKAH
jgi:uncharacterized protein YgiM (DUF1202 family)